MLGFVDVLRAWYICQSDMLGFVDVLRARYSASLIYDDVQAKLLYDLFD